MSVSSRSRGTRPTWMRRTAAPTVSPPISTETMAGAPAILGVVVLCPDVAATQAAERGLGAGGELELRVVEGVLRDGLENTDNPTRNTIVVVPAINTSYYVAMSEENFIEKDINWLRLRDVTFSYELPERFYKRASVFVTGTDLLLITNYSGLDPIVSGNTAATGGSGGVGIDFGNFPMPRGFNFGIKMGF